MNIAEKLLFGEEVTETLETSQGEFTVKMPLARDEVKIEGGVARRCAGIPQKDFSDEAIRYFRVLSTLEVVVLQGPAWWKGPDECGNQEFLGELFGRYLHARSRVLEPIESTGDLAEKHASGNKDAPVGGGVFQGVTYRSKAGSHE